MSKKLDHWIVYGLFDPTTDEIRYVGQTSYVLHHRLSRHIYEAKHFKVCDKKCSWINALLSEGSRPVIKPLQRIDDYAQLAEAETAQILHFRSLGAVLFNETLGGAHLAGNNETQDRRQPHWESELSQREERQAAHHRVENENERSPKMANIFRGNARKN